MSFRNLNSHCRSRPLRSLLKWISIPLVSFHFKYFSLWCETSFWLLLFLSKRCILLTWLLLLFLLRCLLTKFKRCFEKLLVRIILKWRIFWKNFTLTCNSWSLNKQVLIIFCLILFYLILTLIFNWIIELMLRLSLILIIK